MLVAYVFAARSERLICREVQVNLAYRRFCKLGIEDAIPDHSAFSRARNERSRNGDVFRRVFGGSSTRASWPVWLVVPEKRNGGERGPQMLNGIIHGLLPAWLWNPGLVVEVAAAHRVSVRGRVVETGRCEAKDGRSNQTCHDRQPFLSQ
jgi:hypothetical protein